MVYLSHVSLSLLHTLSFHYHSTEAVVVFVNFIIIFHFLSLSRSVLARRLPTKRWQTAHSKFGAFRYKISRMHRMGCLWLQQLFLI